MNTTVTERYRVDQYGNVYDEAGVFYCKWYMLTKKEKRIVRKNPTSAF